MIKPSIFCTDLCTEPALIHAVLSGRGFHLMVALVTENTCAVTINYHDNQTIYLFRETELCPEDLHCPTNEGCVVWIITGRSYHVIHRKNEILEYSVSE